jgi:predicted lipoprotein
MKRNFIVAAPLALAMIVFACDDTTGSPPADYTALLKTLTDGVVLPANATFVQRSDDLAAAAAALESSPNATTLGTAQAAWRSARAAYRALDGVHFGPVADLGISERIDLGPTNPGDVDAIVSGTAPIDATSVGAAGGKAKGFLGVEYLLFSKNSDAAVLALLQGDGAPARRRTLARAMTDEIASSAHQLADAWDRAKGAYANEVTTAGSGSTRYPTQRAAVDDFVGGTAYALELVVGVRLGMPLGRKNKGAPDPSADPTTASDSAVADITASLNGVRALYQGNGFSARIRSKTPALDDEATGQLGDCAAKVSAIPAPFNGSITNDTASVSAAYDSCKTLKSIWNTDITSALGATLKPSDTDGD